MHDDVPRASEPIRWWSAPPSERRAMAEALEQRVASTLAASRGEAAIRESLLDIARTLGFIGSALWMRRSDGHMQCRLFASSVETELFEEQTRSLVFAPGVGMPGRTLQHGTIEWIPNVIRDDNFPRLRGVIRDLIRAVVAFPVAVDGQVIAVVELFARDVLQPDEETSSVMQRLSVTIGAAHGALLQIVNPD